MIQYESTKRITDSISCVPQQNKNYNTTFYPAPPLDSVATRIVPLRPDNSASVGGINPHSSLGPVRSPEFSPLTLPHYKELISSILNNFISYMFGFDDFTSTNDNIDASSTDEGSYSRAQYLPSQARCSSSSLLI